MKDVTKGDILVAKSDDWRVETTVAMGCLSELLTVC